MKLRKPDDTLFNIRGFLPLPIFLLMIVIAIDLTMLYGQEQAELWQVGAAWLLMIYLGVRSWYGINQAVDFSKD